eukprot:2117997-Rhodomonas_salina.3
MAIRARRCVSKRHARVAIRARNTHASRGSGGGLHLVDDDRAGLVLDAVEEVGGPVDKHARRDLGHCARLGGDHDAVVRHAVDHSVGSDRPDRFSETDLRAVRQRVREGRDRRVDAEESCR